MVLPVSQLLATQRKGVGGDGLACWASRALGMLVYDGICWYVGDSLELVNVGVGEFSLRFLWRKISWSKF